ncbi:MAG: ACT domain-containing protein, partial [Bacteroidales bacterium]
MVNLPGISGRRFGVLGRNGVNIRAIAQGSSERNISAVIAKQDLKKSLNALHEEFFESVYKQINLFVTGVGNVGGKLMDQIKRQSAYLEEHLRLQIRLIGVANSRKMHFEEDGIDWNDWNDKLNSGEPMSNERFVAKTISLNKRNSIFIDNTDSSLVAELYDSFLRKSISVVTCNKIACSSHYDTYKKLKRLTHKHNAQFLFETNVGAGLPVINTLNDLLRSGDRVRRIESVLSGTMNFVFNHYDGTKSFAEVVRMAQNEGYTEPDPRVDLCGKDVMRKILILAREAGRKIEMDEITNEGFLPDSCLQGDIEQFYAELEKHEDYFRGLYLKAHSENKRLKFIARMDEDSVSVGLEAVPEESDFYNLGGKDNAVLFYTECYPDYPLVVKGAGAGAAVTASGLFSDIIRAARIS